MARGVVGGPAGKALNMTAHKHLKQLVRSRMQKTGESYTTARAMLLRAEPANGADAPTLAIAGAAGTIALAAAGCELLPLRIDDNLTIPLFVGFTTWIIAALFALPLT